MTAEDDVKAPTHVWLQRDEGPDFRWTWCSDRINDDDVEYLRADRVAELIRQSHETGAVPSDAQIDKFVDSLMGLFCVGDMVKTPHTMESVAREMMRNWLAGFRHETNGCTRSHPHEDMSETCLLRTAIARLQNHLAQKSAQITRLQDGIERMQQGSPETPAEPNLEAFDMHASYDAAKGLEATATFKGDAVKEWCKIAVDWFREVGGKGFVVMDMTDPRDGEHYTLTVQRAGGKTAAQEITELKAQLAALQPSETGDELARLRAELRRLQWRANRAEDFLCGYGSAPLTAKDVLHGGYDHEMRAEKAGGEHGR